MDSIEIRRDYTGFLKGLYRDGFHRISRMILKGLQKGWARIVKKFTWMQKGVCKVSKRISKGMS